jgi:branched-chain amino acid aminotransferase
MLTQQPSASAAPETAPGQPRSIEDLIAYFEGEYVPLRDAKVSIMTHAFMYGTATFEGIRGYWNPEQGILYALFVREHAERIRNSAKMLLMEGVPSTDELVAIILETVRRNHFHEDVYIRPSFYKSTKAIGVRLHHLDHELYVLTTPFGNYIDIEKGVRVMTSTWRRNADEALPALTPSGHASEASAANLFVVRDGVLITPPVSDDILEGVTRHAMMTLAQDLGIPVEVRSVDRSELYVCDEAFLCGTGVQVSPVIEVDHRPVGTGAVGPVSRAISERYFAAVRGTLPEYRSWLTPVEG